LLSLLAVWLLRVSRTDVNATVADLGHLHLGDKSLSNVISKESNETEASASTGVSVSHDLDIFNLTIVLEVLS
jgi:hypothetical protein